MTTSVYGRVLRHPVLRPVLPAVLLSALGDGMSLVAVAWLAVHLAPPETRGLWTGAAIAAFTLPGTVGAFVFGPLVRGLNGARLVAVDAWLRAAALGAVPVLALAGLLTPVTLVALLAVSSLLHAWGGAGAYTLVAELLPPADRVAGNALLSVFAQAAMVVGPALAGFGAALVGPAWVIGADAVTFAVLAGVCTWTGRKLPRIQVGAERPGGLATVRRYPVLLGLIAVTCVFNGLFGPVEVALPVHVAELGGTAGALGAYWAALSAGMVLGALGTAMLRERPLWAVVGAVIVGWGIAVLPVALTDSVPAGLLGFAIGGIVYGPYTALCTELFQRSAPPESLSAALALRAALTGPSAGLGTVVGGVLIGVLGARHTLLASAVGTIALGLAVSAGSWRHGRSEKRRPSGARPRRRPESGQARSTRRAG